ncbi:nuclease PIN [Salmonella enterica subsp. enterica serovar Lexington]|uniref:Nuclease PIN n=1 Tax=Salmonella enterica subsp. indica TaxID=59207 RepID=A0A379YLF9_SALER|nr:pilus-assembly fibrillin subunit [Salmonella enterica]EAA0562657.1 nuclease PIN [Salmonella enterica subsp. enterica serovar Lexington]EBP3214351.1 nuclease PIN [Salmonella enterica subsp. arizonae]ECM3796601.1 nuclease PIN [Salmonella enterica subsp. enterica serovar Newport]EDV1074447.1 nuclease PIN [Salmonella enterica subsp. enterica]EDW0192252.1 nuclease PIN [Salmonella enterica subsp. enterica serovar Orion]EDW8089636.1 nuclease PIN [Salmonella enterica subsp. houtenae]EEC4250960.1 
MKKVTTAIGLIALLLSTGMNSVVLHAGELLTRERFFVADESQHQWVNERDTRTGVLEVRGALLSSPCKLQTSEIQLPQEIAFWRGGNYPLSLGLTGCGYGDSLTSVGTPAGRTTVMMVYSALLAGKPGGVLQPEQRVLGTGRAVLHGGSGKLTWYLSDAQRQLLAKQKQTTGVITGEYRYFPEAVLRLRLDYE